MTLRPGQKKQMAKKQSTAKNDVQQEVEKHAERKKKTPIYGVLEIADYLGYSMRTVHRWRFEFKDFPVISEGVSCTWISSIEDLDAWKDKHADLFRYRKEREEIAIRERERNSRRFRRW